MEIRKININGREAVIIGPWIGDIFKDKITGGRYMIEDINNNGTIKGREINGTGVMWTHIRDTRVEWE